MHYIRVWAIVVAAIMLTSCAATGPLFQPAPPPDSGKALVYVYRPDGFMLGGRDAHFYVDNKHVVNLSAGGYTHFHIDPGSHVIKQNWPIDLMMFGTLELPLDANPDETIYYRFFSGSGNCSYDTSGKVCFKFTLQRVTESAANDEISKCRYQAAK